jgi:branched-chain amino acid transport system permease protein
MLNLALQIIVNGLVSGSTYVLVALGFTLIFGIMRVLNFAHGELYMMGCYAVYIYASAGLNYFAALVLGAITVGLLGVLFERTLFRWVIGREVNGLIVALGLSVALRALALIIFGPDEIAVPRPVSGSFRFGGIFVPYDRVLVCGLALAIMLLFYFFLTYTRLGLAMRAVAQDERIASAQGVRPAVIYAAAFGLGSLLAGLAGGLMAPIYTVDPTIGESAMSKAFIIVVLGGLGSIPGAVVGGLLLGLTESLFSTLIDGTVAAMLVFVLVVVVILVRPEGLLRRTT